jgi:hypothetical protein
MDFGSGRMSMMRASQPGTGRKQQPEPDDAFMMVIQISLSNMSRFLHSTNMVFKTA